MTYTQLQTDIAGYLHRTDLAAKIPGFIALAESAMFRELNIKDIQVLDEGQTSEGFIYFPADFAFVVRLTVTTGGVERTLDYIAPTESDKDGYTFEQGGIRIFGPDTAYNLYYTPVIAALSDLKPTNWLLTNAPDLYLYASCLEGSKHTRDAEQMSTLSGIVGGLMDSVRRLTNRKYLPTGSLQIKPRR